MEKIQQKRNVLYNEQECHSFECHGKRHYITDHSYLNSSQQWSSVKEGHVCMEFQVEMYQRPWMGRGYWLEPVLQSCPG